MGLTILNAIAILALNTLAVSAQAYSCECDGLVPVDWDDCKQAKGFSWASADDD